MTFNALVLAGSRGGADPLAAATGIADKALIEIDGRTMMARVVEALRGAGAARILAATSSATVRDHALALGIEPFAADAGPSRSTARGLALLGAPLLVTTADHPLLRPEWIGQFLADLPADIDVAALMARRELVQTAAPATRRTYLRFADGAWSGCNLFYLATAQAAAAIELWREVEGDRKKPWRIVRRLGTGMLLRYLTGRLPLATALAHVGRLAGVRATLVASRHGAAAIDVDTPADLELVTRLIRAAEDSAPRQQLPGS